MNLLRGAFWLLVETLSDHRPSPRRAARPLLRSPWRVGALAAAVLLGLVVTGSWLSYQRDVEAYYAAQAAPKPTATEEAADVPGNPIDVWATPTPTETAPTATPTETAAPAPTEVELEEHAEGDLHDHAGEDAPPADATDTLGIATAASTFTNTWLSGAGLRDTTAVTEWRTRVNATVDPVLIPALDATDPATIPTATVTSSVVTASSVAEGTVLVLLSDATTLEVTVTTTPAGWLVTNYQPVSS